MSDSNFKNIQGAILLTVNRSVLLGRGVLERLIPMDAVTESRNDL
jgi:hypothetical protein